MSHTIEERMKLRGIEREALEALRKECKDQQEVNELLWAMVASLRAAKQGVN